MQFFFAGRGGKSCALLCSSGVMPIKMALKQKGVHFVLCPKQGNKIEGVVINRVCVLRIFCRKKGQGPRCSAAHLYPNIGRLSPDICEGLEGYFRDSGFDLYTVRESGKRLIY